MRSAWATLITGLATLGLIVASVVVDVPVMSPTQHAIGAPTVSDTGAADVDYAKRKGKKQRRHKKKKKKRQRSRAKPGKCAGMEKLAKAGRDLCSHGPDPAPPGFNTAQAVPLAAESVAAGGPSVVCDGDGQSGFRVQPLFVHGADVANRYTQSLPSLREWVVAADQIFQTNAAYTGGTRNLRFVHDASCTPLILDVQITAAGDDSFGNTIRDVIAQGYNRTDRIYLMFVDTTAAGICGISTMSDDDRASDDNWNNDGPSYARIDAGCWSGSVAAHELMHNLGGVQHSAPHATGAGHCIDEYDIMCYRDSSSAPPLQYACASSVFNLTRLDCGFDDYYNANPAPGSYLATHWNPTNSRFMIIGPNIDPVPLPPSPPTAGPSPGASVKADKKAKHQRKKAKGKRKGAKAKHKKR